MRRSRASLVAAAVLCLMSALPAAGENTDPGNDGSQYAWAENVGWISAEPSGNDGPGMQVGDNELSGWMWGENVGWVSLSCDNTLSCATTDYGVVNDGNGMLAGYAWSENAGWLSFACEDTASCGSADHGVEIDPESGDFSGHAWGENIGWISFNCANTDSCATVDHKVRTGWKCSPAPGAPSGSPGVTLDKSGSDVLLTWDLVPAATGSDIVRGDIACLQSSGGDFTACTGICLDNNRTTTSMLDSATPPSGQGYWYSVRGQNCGGNGTYDSRGVSQVGLRDAEIAGSGDDCP
jgi:hypothetical protein